jgi:hypothetical protein
MPNRSALKSSRSIVRLRGRERSKALAHARKAKAAFVVAKLDRLAGNVALVY